MKVYIDTTGKVPYYMIEQLSNHGICFYTRGTQPHEYNATILDRYQIKRLVSHLQLCLENMNYEPDRKD